MTECARCGACCEMIVIPLKMLSKRDIEYFRARGLKEEQGFFIVPHRCEQLMTSSSLPRATCLINDHKPETCRRFKGKSQSAGVMYYVPERCAMRS